MWGVVVVRGAGGAAQAQKIRRNAGFSIRNCQEYLKTTNKRPLQFLAYSCQSDASLGGYRVLTWKREEVGKNGGQKNDRQTNGRQGNERVSSVVRCPLSVVRCPLSAGADGDRRLCAVCAFVANSWGSHAKALRREGGAWCVIRPYSRFASYRTAGAHSVPLGGRHSLPGLPLRRV